MEVDVYKFKSHRIAILELISFPPLFMFCIRRARSPIIDNVREMLRLQYRIQCVDLVADIQTIALQMVEIGTYTHFMVYYKMFMSLCSESCMCVILEFGFDIFCYIRILK
jgi:hypothetical protein